MKFIDIKSLLILILLGTSIVFFSIWYFNVSDYKGKIKSLEGDINKIEKTRDSLKSSNINLKSEFEKKQKEISDRDEKINKVESELLNTKKDLYLYVDKLNNNIKDLEETKRKITELEKNPIKRDGQDLINSLKEKLK